MAEQTYWSHDEDTVGGERFIVRVGSLIYGNVTVERQTLDDEAVLVLTHKKGDRWTVREDAVANITRFVPKER